MRKLRCERRDHGERVETKREGSYSREREEIDGVIGASW